MQLKDLKTMLSGKVHPTVAKKRWETCKMCEFITYTNRCTKCGCFMQFKTRFKKAACPINKWSRE